MSVRDADLFEVLLHRIAVQHDSGSPFRVIEWGAGRSTLWYPTYLAALGVRYQWVTVEHYRQYFDAEVGPTIAQRGGVVVDGTVVKRRELAAATPDVGTLAVVFDAGELKPFESGREQDRQTDLDDYVDVGDWLGWRFDLAVVDGRKRRRCLVAVAGLLADGGYALLHDAWRRHYQCAWASYKSGRRFGDELWIGAQHDTDFTNVLPPHAFWDPMEHGP